MVQAITLHAISPASRDIVRLVTPRTLIRLVIALLLVSTALSAQKLSVSVFDERTGRPVGGLTVQNFEVTDGSLPLSVESAEYTEELLDIMLVADTSFLGEAVQPLLFPMIQGLPQGAQMALVTFDQSATMLQDFTNSKDTLVMARDNLKYVGNPRVLDALYAVIDGGFSGSPGRRVVVVLSSGVEGRSRTRLSEIVEVAQQNNVAIFMAYANGTDANLFEQLAGNTGGAWFHLKKLGLRPKGAAELILTAMRGSYLLEVSGVDQFGDKLRVEITGLPKSKMKIVASVRPVD